MSRLNKIQMEIKQLEGGRFQKLCDTYLYRKLKWDNILALGSKEGTDKTTKGIPDTYHLNRVTGKYKLVMYGTRKDSTAKLEQDVEEAINKSKLGKDKIEEIICCHTSSNITVKKDCELRKLASGIELTLIGIDTLSHDFTQIKYQDIVFEYLNIENTTEQVWNLTQFISIHDKSLTNATLSTKFIEESNVIEELLELLATNQVLLLSGPPGVGKTKLSVELLKKVDREYNTICVKSNDLPAYQDIKDNLDNTKLNYLFLDDGNTVHNFKSILGLLHNTELDGKLKIIITVRDYEKDILIEYLKSYKVKSYIVPKMNDEQIKLLVDSLNPNILEFEKNRILKLSRNNPRLVVIASTMLNNKNYEFLTNGIEILDSYYKKIVKDNKLSDEEKKTLFILSFLNTIDKNDKNSLADILLLLNLSYELFLQCIDRLYQKELCDIYQNKAVKITDQSLEDYIILNFIVDDKRIEIKDIFRELYPKYSDTIFKLIKRVCNFNQTKEWFDKLSSDMKFVFSTLEDTSDKENFLMQYSSLIPYDSICYASKYIEDSERVSYSITQEKFDSEKSFISVKDPIIKILASLAYTDSNRIAGQLLIEYFNKRQDKVLEVYSVIIENFNVEDTYKKEGLCKPLIIIDLLLKQEEVNEVLSILIINIAEEFLNFSGEKISSIGDGNKMTFTRYKLVDGEYIQELHVKIYKLLYRVYNFGYDDITLVIDKLLLNYPIDKVKDGYVKTITSDVCHIQSLFFKDLSKLNYRQEIIISKLSTTLQDLGICLIPFKNYKGSSKQNCHKWFSSFDYDFTSCAIKKLSNDEWQILRKSELDKIFKEYEKNLKKLFNTLAIYQKDELLDSNEFEENIFKMYLKANTCFKKRMLIDLLNSDFELDKHINYYMKELSFEDGKEVILNLEHNDNDSYVLSNILCCNNSEDTCYKDLLSVLNNLKDIEILNKFNVLEFKRYIEKQPDILTTLFELYDNNLIESKFFIPQYIFEDSVDCLIDIVGIEKLKEIYLKKVHIEKLDKSAALFRSLLKDNDQEFLLKFLKNLQSVRFGINNGHYEKYFEYIWESSIIEDVLDSYLDYLIVNKNLISIGVDFSLRIISKNNTKRFYQFVIEKIKRTSDENTLVVLYNLSSELFIKEDIINLFKILREKKFNENMFKKIHLLGISKCWSGSRVPLLDEDLDFLGKLITIFEDDIYFPYCLIISNQIEAIKDCKNKELLKEYKEE